MPVEVRIPSLLRRIVGGEKSVSGEGGTIGQVLDDIEARFPDFKSRLIGEDGKLHQFIGIYLNDEDVRFLNELETAVADGDVISILPAAAGGEIWLNWRKLTWR